MLQIRLLGNLSISWEGQLLEGFGVQRVQELFSYLLLHPEQPHSREKLMQILWPEQRTVQARKTFSNTLWQLQNALNPKTWPIDVNNSKKADASARFEPPLLINNPPFLELNPRALYWLDVGELRQSFNLLAALPPGQPLSRPTLQALEIAVNLYQGELLAGWEQPWSVVARVQLKEIYLELLDRLMDEALKQRNYTQGLVYGHQSLGQDYTREATQQRMMSLYYLAGNRAAALEQYQRFTVALKERLHAEPTGPITSLYQQILTENLALPSSFSTLSPFLSIPESKPFPLIELASLSNRQFSPEHKFPEPVVNNSALFELLRLQKDLQALTLSVVDFEAQLAQNLQIIETLLVRFSPNLVIAPLPSQFEAKNKKKRG